MYEPKSCWSSLDARVADAPVAGGRERRRDIAGELREGAGAAERCRNSAVPAANAAMGSRQASRRTFKRFITLLPVFQTRRD